MDSSMVEGISTSPKHCSPKSPSFPLPGHSVPVDSSSSVMPSFLLVNDLGLTPSPGSQLQQRDDSVQESSRAEGPQHSQVSAEKSIADTPADWDTSWLCDDFWRQVTDGYSLSLTDEQALCFPDLGDSASIQNSGQLMGLLNTGNSGVTDSILQISDPENGGLQSISGDPADLDKAFLPDPLFDAEFGLHDFDLSLTAQKRSADEAFPTDLNYPVPLEKRRIIEVPLDQGTAPSVGTPYLSSPNSSHQTGSETTITTPADTERPQTPDSLFDSNEDDFGDEPLFTTRSEENVALDLPSEYPTKTGSPAIQLSVTDHCPTIAYDSQPVDHGSHYSTAIGAQVTKAFDTPTHASDMTGKRFALQSQDVAATKINEVLKRQHSPRDYVSPYPVNRGLLGYLPSAPAVHVKSIEVAPESVCLRVKALQLRIKQLTHECQKYRSQWLESTTIDNMTGKSKVELLKEELGSVRRVSGHHQSKLKEARQEAEGWKKQAQHYATIYNELLYNVQHKLPIATFVSPAHAPPYAPGLPQAQHLAPVSRQQIPLQQIPVQKLPPQQFSPQQFHPQQIPQQIPPRERVTVDLTLDSDTESTPEPQQTPSEPKQTPENAEALKKIRNKKYQWLDRSNHPQHPALAPAGTRDINADRGPPVLNADEELIRTLDEELAKDR
ncbi:hypothetical protein ASPZODRAFT_138984 [Penicilliopsis zonata CBS 506.65]|uniref:Uncharacterized protein n=1 Tax=Penicilliopsis zonata CBS 506.65 TaxID=1073090 RepID=A0A1L9SR56_9EURO|nr:hypothetical protein ASPZODRAFT_138984 [Penicilliopsis zonata CBS 506.65]OJJ49603.1 hypothetical protein ASPZODRAFT_138984 [Penicilliopsis zonata CBS 506.65]